MEAKSTVPCEIKIMKKLFLLFLVIIVSCDNKQADPPFISENSFIQDSINGKLALEPEKPIINNSIDMMVIGELEFEAAKKKYGEPLRETHFVLNEKPIKGGRRMIISSFTEKELELPITIKETEWDSKNEYLIMIHYKVENEKWMPVSAFSFRKTMDYLNHDFKNIEPKK